MILFLRLLPILVAASSVLLFYWQRSLPGIYPYFALAAVLLLPIASIVMSWRRVSFSDMMEKMAPTFLLGAALAFALLLVETPFATWTLLIAMGVACFLSLELLFLLAYEPSAYPVNGLSRLNIAYVPLTVWYAVSTSAGIITFLHTPGVWHVALCTVLGIVLFRTTGHPGATKEQNRLWTVIGGIAGAEIGWLGLQLPLSIAMQGIVAAVLFCSVLRVRRYLYDPRPSMRTAWIEGLGIIAFLAVSIATAKWV